MNQAQQSFNQDLKAMGDREEAHFLVRIRRRVATYGDVYDHLSLGLALVHLDRYSEAERLLKHKAFVEIARYRRARFLKDIEPKDKILSAVAGMEEARCEFLGDLYRQKGHFTAGIRWYERALHSCDEESRRNPARAERVAGRKTRLHDRLGECFWRLGKFRKASRHVRQSLADPSWEEEARSFLGVICRSEGLYAHAARYFEQAGDTEALEDLRQARALPSHLTREQLLELRGPVAVVVGATRYLQTHPEDTEIRFELCDSWSRLFRFDKALALVRALERRYGEQLPEVVDVTTRRSLMARLFEKKAYIFKNQGRYRTAAGWFRRAATLEPDNATHWTGQGTCEARRGNLAKAESLLRQSTMCSSGSRENAWLSLGLVLRSLERFSEAADSLRLALELNPNNESAQLALLDVSKATDYLASLEELNSSSI